MEIQRFKVGRCSQMCWVHMHSEHCLQVRKLGEKEWEFENAKKAFGDTMRKFAPGGGAGHFLANAIARRTDAVIAHPQNYANTGSCSKLCQFRKCCALSY